MVECEYLHLPEMYCYLTVLIDTWWNVNIGELIKNQFNERVLIDTWWNVNKIAEDIANEIEEVLIDTWWNVN